MTEPTEEDKEPSHYPLSDALYSYIAVLVQRAPGTISFRTGSGRILRDLMVHWPMLAEWENETLELCHHITDGVYPLTSSLLAQGVEIEITISPTPLEITGPIDAMATLLLFDLKDRQEHKYFLSPATPMITFSSLRVTKGIAVLCRPLNHSYHSVKDSREKKANPGTGIFELVERQINEIAAMPDLVEREKTLAALVKNNLQNLPQYMMLFTTLRGAVSVTERRVPGSASMPVKIPNSMSFFERNLLAYIIDATLSADFRAGMRKIVQIIRNHNPQEIFNELAKLETAAHIIKTVSQKSAAPAASAQANDQSLRTPDAQFPKAVPATSVGRLDKSVQATASKNDPASHILKHGPAFPTLSE